VNNDRTLKKYLTPNRVE